MVTSAKSYQMRLVGFDARPDDSGSIYGRLGEGKKGKGGGFRYKKKKKRKEKEARWHLVLV